MDPDEVMSRMRDAMIQISDLVSMRLTLGGSALSKAEIERAVEEAEQILHHGNDLLDWLRRGGFPPG